MVNSVIELASSIGVAEIQEYEPDEQANHRSATDHGAGADLTGRAVNHAALPP